MSPTRIIIALVLATQLSHASSTKISMTGKTIATVNPLKENTVMWYTRAADDYGLKSPLRSWTAKGRGNPDQAWEKYALPVGNGSLGAMLYGGVARERIQFNVLSLWAGGPGSKNWKSDLNIPGTYKHLPEIREALIGGDAEKAQKLSTEYLNGKSGSDFGKYQTFGEIYITTGQDDPEKVSGYHRQLDLATALNTVRYRYGKTTFTRTAFCSNPDQCFVMRFEADQPQTLHLELASPHKIKTAAKDGLFIATGIVENNGLKLDARIGILHQGGQVKIDTDGIQITGADHVTLILVANTDYAQDFPKFRGKDPAVKNTTLLKSALATGYEKLKSRHMADYQALFNRVAIDLGTTDTETLKLPTDERLERNKQTPDHDLEELYFQYARYLLISCSRPGGLPANLQGIWCNQLNPPWQSDYHLNINLQMNYWPSGPCNLLECQEPLIDYIQSLTGPGAATAKAYSNAKGWTANLGSNIWGFTAPHSNKRKPRYWIYYPMAGPWLSTHAWEHYAFGLDQKYLEETAWPILSGSADFTTDYLYKLPTGELSSIPSWSPEHGKISKGSTTDIAMAREALKNALAAAQVLHKKTPQIAQWEKTKEQLVPYKIGQHGQLQEWYEDRDNPNDHHRHVNHLFGLHPGSQIDPIRTPELLNACRTTLTQRGDGATGWSMGWKINFWARLHDGDHAYLLVRNLFKDGTNPNLFDVHPPFQIDGNFGGCAGMAEMLLQSRYHPQGGEITLLPALPSDWSTGSVQGLLARGGFTVDITWKNGKLVQAKVTASQPRQLLARWGNKTWKHSLKAGESVMIKP